MIKQKLTKKKINKGSSLRFGLGEIINMLHKPIFHGFFQKHNKPIDVIINSFYFWYVYIFSGGNFILQKKYLDQKKNYVNIK